ncbi:MAG: hypothetical protein DME48_06825 [Verrucomicrobia bacterium]|nr:MAG: hypothetical protein DME48_06825 [Verrucomicrobiota bacterium]
MTAAVASSPQLLDRVRWHLRVKHYSTRTEQAHIDWIRRYILFHRKRHPTEMGHVKASLTCQGPIESVHVLRLRPALNR